MGFMKRVLAAVLSALMMISMTACSEEALPDPVTASSQVALTQPEDASEPEEEPQQPQEDPAGEETASSQAEASQAQDEAPTVSYAPESPAPPVNTSTLAAQEENSAASSSSSQPEQEVSSQPQAAEPEEEEEEEEVFYAGGSTAQLPDEMIGDWLSYLDLQRILQGKTKAEFTSAIRQEFASAADYGINTVFVQVRPFGDALYESELFPWSHLASGTEGVDPGYDPLAIMVREAHNQGLRIEAWLNPYRVRNSGTKAEISRDNIAYEWLSDGSGRVVKTSAGTFYNPASAQVRQLIIDGVVEIVTNYDVDGIHFDDYFYPTTETSFDSSFYQSSGSGMSLADWRRENVNKLIRGVYSAIKSVDSSLTFGVSPAGNLDNNYNLLYVDAAKWLSSSGYVDYIMPQVYFGYENATCPYAETVEAWDDLITNDRIKLYVGLAVYKVGADTAEWNSASILARQLETARDAGHYGGVALYRHDFLFQPSYQNSYLSAALDQLQQLI